MLCKALCIVFGHRFEILEKRPGANAYWRWCPRCGEKEGGFGYRPCAGCGKPVENEEHWDWNTTNAFCLKCTEKKRPGMFG